MRPRETAAGSEQPSPRWPPLPLPPPLPAAGPSPGAAAAAPAPLGAAPPSIPSRAVPFSASPLPPEAAALALTLASSPATPSVPFLLSDWYGDVSPNLLAGLARPYPADFKWVGDPRSILVNGRGVAAGTCANASAAAGPCRAQVEVVRFDPGRPLLLRVANAASLSFLNIALGGGARWTVVQSDGWDLQPFQAAALDVNAGGACFTQKDRRS